MSRQCLVCGIPQRPGDKDRSFHKFPKLQERRNNWLATVGRDEVSRYAVLCSDHFTYEDFCADPGKMVEKRRLRSIAVPSCNLIPKTLTNSRHDAWMEALGRNPNIEHLSSSNVVCSEHFTEENKMYSNKCVRLKSNAVPTLKLKKRDEGLIENQGYLNSPTRANRHGCTERQVVPMKIEPVDADVKIDEPPSPTSMVACHPSPIPFDVPSFNMVKEEIIQKNVVNSKGPTLDFFHVIKSEPIEETCPINFQIQSQQCENIKTELSPIPFDVPSLKMVKEEIIQKNVINSKEPTLDVFHIIKSEPIEEMYPIDFQIQSQHCENIKTELLHEEYDLPPIKSEDKSIWTEQPLCSDLKPTTFNEAS